MPPDDLAQLARPVPRPEAFTVRLLFPFLIERRSARRGAELLCAAARGVARGLWTQEPPRRLYRYRLDMTGQLDRFLFSGAASGSAGGAYLLAAPAVTQRWLGELTVELPRRAPARIGLDDGSGVELFLTGHGAGVLSLGFVLRDTLDASGLVELNSRLAQLTRPGERAPWLVVGPAPEPAPAAAPDHAGPAAPLEPPPAADPAIPLLDRLQRPGSRFALAELVVQLLEPLRPLGLTPTQDALCAYTVVRLPAGPDLSDGATRAALGPLVSTLAQVETPRRAPPAGRRLGVPNLLIDARHWTAASLQGSTHVLIDREEGGAEAEKVAALVRDKYFIPYLTALLQRCAIKRAAEEATDMVVGAGAAHEPVSALRSQVLEFVLAGALPEVSVRSSLHRYYRLCQKAADLRRNMGQVRRALADLEAQLAARQQMEISEAQRQMAGRAAESLESSHKIHAALAWIEVFIVVAYAAELVKFFLIELHEIEQPLWRAVATTLVVAPGLVALAVLRPWRHRHGHRPG